MSKLRGALTFSSILVAVSALAACGGSAGSSSDQVAQLDTGTQAAASTSPTSTTASGSFQDTLLKFAQCMRSKGVDVPDPTFDANGRPVFSQGQQQRLNLNDPAFRTAFDACRTILQSSLPQVSQADRQAFQNAALQYAQCMRQNGIDIPDPDFSNGGGFGFGFRAGGGNGGGNGGGGGGGPFGSIDRNDPKFQAANEKCRSAFQNLPGGGPFGGGPQGGTTTGS